MNYFEIFILKDGMKCCIRNGVERDAQAALDHFLLTHGQTNYLLTYPDEPAYEFYGKKTSYSQLYLKEKRNSKREIEIVAIIDRKIAGMAGINTVGSTEKTRHRAEFGISIDKKYWGLGLGWKMTKVCIACARAANYQQLELEVVADNKRAISLYQKAGFIEYGRNPRGFLSRTSGFQELVLMRLEL